MARVGFSAAPYGVGAPFMEVTGVANAFPLNGEGTTTGTASSGALGGSGGGSALAMLITANAAGGNLTIVNGAGGNQLVLAVAAAETAGRIHYFNNGRGFRVDHNNGLGSKTSIVSLTGTLFYGDKTMGSNVMNLDNTIKAPAATTGAGAAAPSAYMVTSDPYGGTVGATIPSRPVIIYGFFLTGVHATLTKNINIYEPDGATLIKAIPVQPATSRAAPYDYPLSMQGMQINKIYLSSGTYYRGFCVGSDDASVTGLVFWDFL